MFMSLLQNPTAVTDAGVLGAVFWGEKRNVADAHPAGDGALVDGGDVLSGPGIAFVLSKGPLQGDGVIARQEFEFDPSARRVLIRLDEVCFPVGAIAHRHTHSGPGFRYLTRGSLRIEAQSHSQTMTVGDAWFEPAHTPVRAVALQSEGVSSFTRCMVLPLEDKGRSTFALADPKDADLPRLQSTYRHVDHVLQLDAG